MFLIHRTLNSPTTKQPVQDLSRQARDGMRRVLRAVDWLAAAERERSRRGSSPSLLLASTPEEGFTPEAADAADPGLRIKPRRSSEGGKDVGGGQSGGEHPGQNPEKILKRQPSKNRGAAEETWGLGSLWTRAARASPQLRSVELAIQDWTERFWQVQPLYIVLSGVFVHARYMSAVGVQCLQPSQSIS